jgi:hypothetical protein
MKYTEVRQVYDALIENESFIFGKLPAELVETGITPRIGGRGQWIAEGIHWLPDVS